MRSHFQVAGPGFALHTCTRIDGFVARQPTVQSPTRLFKLNTFPFQPFLPLNLFCVL